VRIGTDMALLYLIRHGQASFGESQYDRLSGIGERQARILGHHLKRGLHGLDALCSGGMERHDRTAEIAREAMGEDPPPLRTEQAFAEYDHIALFDAYLPAFLESLGEEAPADLEALLADSRLLERALRFVLGAWYENQPHEGPPIETWPAFCARVATGVDDLLRRHGPRERVAVVTSGGPISAILRSVLGLSNRRVLRINLSVYNASVTQIFCPAQGRLADSLLLGYNNITHLEMTGDRDLITFR
jgi:broad specificity phosphatase PhoE